MENNLLVVHGGGPSAVLNASLYGVIKEARNYGIKHIYGAKGGSEGVLKEAFWKLENLSEEEMERMLQTPGSAIGTSRFALTEEDYQRMLEIFEKVSFSKRSFSIESEGSASKILPIIYRR